MSKFTDEPPCTPGWYWMRPTGEPDDSDEKMIACVSRCEHGELYVAIPGEQGFYHMDDFIEGFVDDVGAGVEWKRVAGKYKAPTVACELNDDELAAPPKDKGYVH
jgi:hypothetical protein